ncbi:MAG: hypothetical protein WA900_08740 [Casimicrobiaceae bacterium]
MKTGYRAGLSLAIGLALAGAFATAQAQPFNWKTVVNNGYTMPNSTALFNSYNQPSVNARGLVVFRARSKGSQQPVRGIYERDMRSYGPLVEVTSVGATVPQPNNTYYGNYGNSELAQFNEFPAFPRIDSGSSTIATRGQSQPVWTYLLADGSETRVGTAGIYTNPGGELTTGASLLGAVRGPGGGLVFSQYQVPVPGAALGTRFDQFPGSAAVTGGATVAFKGNYTDTVTGIGMTGVYYRDVVANGGASHTYLIANSATRIPNQPAGGSVNFGSTAPPSAEGGYLYFAGFDDEDAPTLGGIYRARLAQPPVLQTLVGIGAQVPGEAAGTPFNRFGESLSVSSDGRYVVFWGAWGTEVTAKILACPTDGNADLIGFCKAAYPTGHMEAVPVHQGIFAYDTRKGSLAMVAKTGTDGVQDFLYWVFSGQPPGTGGGDEGEGEPPRWRASAFAAVSAKGGTAYRVAFKAARSGVDGIYLHKSPGVVPLATVVEIGSSGTVIDPLAPAGSLVSALGIERDGFRDRNLAVTASMLEPATSTGWAGIYLTTVPGGD